MSPEIRPAVAKLETEMKKNMSITVIGPSCSGKSTLMHYLGERGYTVHKEPNNDVIFPLFLKYPHRYAFDNQLNLTARLLELEVQAMNTPVTDPHFRESGVLATQIYNRYLRDKGFISREQFDHLDWLYKDHLAKFPKPDMVVYLTASELALKDRAIERDGAISIPPEELQKYWDELICELENDGIPVKIVNTYNRPIEDTAGIILGEVESMKQLTKIDKQLVS
jgi:deoxyadenosine/deoxycytidine kinase